jgi:hypothetical protein
VSIGVPLNGLGKVWAKWSEPVLLAKGCHGRRSLRSKPMAEVLDCAHVEPAKDSCGMTPERYCRVRRFSGENKPPARKTAGLLAVTLLASIALADTQSQTGKAHAGSLQAVKNPFSCVGRK